MGNGILNKYGSLLPLTEKTPRLSLCEGDTPLIPLKNISNDLEIEAYAKFDGLNPTGSFKDRGMVMAVSKALEEGAKAVICASTGNTSASAAAYSAHAGIPCFVLLPAGNVALGKLAQALIYGARVIAIKGNFDRALELARQASGDMGIAIVNSVNPYRLWGQRSASWEICDELGDSPDWLVVPVGNAGNISAYYDGFNQYAVMGKCNAIPRLVGVQAEGAAPMVRGCMISDPETVATAIRIGCPVSHLKASNAVKQTAGRFLSVSDEEILKAQVYLAGRDGIFAEPASCTTIASLVKLKKLHSLPSGIKVVCVLTGNGLKDPDAALLKAPSPVEINAEWESLREVLQQ